MGGLELRADCARCTGLCCVALAFDRGAAFAFDKAAGAPCPNLSTTNRCRVHDRLSVHGLVGCTRYDCHGAGQRLCAELFPGRSWREGSGVARQMFEAFRVLRRAHELYALLDTASHLNLTSVERARRAELCDALERAGARATEVERLEAPVRDFLRGLRRLVQEPARVRRLALAP